MTQIFKKTVHVCYMNAEVLRRLLVNTTWGENRSIEDSEEHSTIFYTMLDLNIQNRSENKTNKKKKKGNEEGNKIYQV